MASASLAFPLLSSLLLLSIAEAQQHLRSPHGLAFENPMSLSPSAFDFFHPKHPPPAGSPCTDPQCAHLQALSASSKARADPAHDTVSASNGGVRAGHVAAVVVGLAFVMLVAVGASYVVVRRHANSRKASNMVKPDA